MILDTIRNAEKYGALHPEFRKAFDALKKISRMKFMPGRVEISEGKSFALLAESKGKGREKARLETHRKFVDIQAVLKGEDLIGWKNKTDCLKRLTPYDRTKDIEFFDDNPESWIVLKPGLFAIFFPEDAHAPLAGKGTNQKAVVKVAVSHNANKGKRL